MRFFWLAWEVLEACGEKQEHYHCDCDPGPSSSYLLPGPPPQPPNWLIAFLQNLVCRTGGSGWLFLNVHQSTPTLCSELSIDCSWWWELKTQLLTWSARPVTPALTGAPHTSSHSPADPWLSHTASHSPWAVSTLPSQPLGTVSPDVALAHASLESSSCSSGFSYYPSSDHCAPCSLTLCPLRLGSTYLCLACYYILFNLLFSQLPCFLMIRTLFTLVLLKPETVSST